MPDNLLVLVATLLAAIIAAAAGLAGVWHQVRARRQQQAEARADEATRVFRRYRDPLIRAAFDLQSRLYNIVTHDFLGKYYVRGTEAEREYALENTIFVIGEYFGWVEVLRREIQFLEMRNVERNRELARRLDRVSGTFLAEQADATFRVFRGEQRAIGEVMLSSQPGGGHDCLGYAAFVARRQDPAFRRWFAKLAADVEALANEPGQHLERVLSIQHELIDLLAFLDPDHQYLPESARDKAVARVAAGTDTAVEGAAPADGASGAAIRVDPASRGVAVTDP